MAMSLGPIGGEERDDLVSSINTTPLVDVMLVLLIIFLITIPVVTHTVPVALPHEVNQPTQTKPQTIIISISKDGDLFWNAARLADAGVLLAKLEERAVAQPQPEVQIRADRDARYEFVGRVVTACQRAGIAKIAFILQPEHGAGATP
ncbi:MAG TPA: biopolymer transporter ExbD [Stellaceae bacterium]|nr:biopolymer transporter ExbD [Stellaceae bacterium]